MANPVPIPAGTPPGRCGGCPMTIYWIVTPKGNRMPISVAFPDAFAPTETEAGQGYSHHADCPNAPKYRKKRQA